VIEEDIAQIKKSVQHLIEEVYAIKKHIIPEKQDTTELSKKVVEELKTGDEPRHYKNGRKPKAMPFPDGNCKEGVSTR